MKVKLYALYKGDQFIDVGTIKELARKRGVKQSSILFLQSPAYKTRIKEQHESLELINVGYEDTNNREVI